MRLSTIRVLAAFLILAAGCTAADPLDRHEGVIDLASVAIDTGAAAPAGAEARAADRSGEYLLVQLDGSVSAADIAALEESVERVYAYLPHDSFLVRVAPDQPLAGLGAWAGVYRPEYKIARNLRESAVRAADGDVETLMVQAYPDADIDALLREVVRAQDTEVVGKGAGARFARIRLRVAADRAVAVAESLAEIPEVFWIDVEARRTLLNDTTIWVGQSGVTGGQTTPIFASGIHGEGQVVGYIDTGADVDSCFYRDTARGLPPQNACNGGTVVDAGQRKVLAADFLWSNECAGGIASTEWDTQNHGTHVGATIAGDNFANPIEHDTADGMAPGAKLVVQDAGFATDECEAGILHNQ